MTTHEQNPQIEPKTKTPEAQQPQRDPNGRYARGNDGGPGNPFGRQVGKVRKQVLAFMNEERMNQLVESIFARATQGDMVAAKLLMQYSIGKPTEAPNPDHLDLDEYGFYRREAGMLEFATRVQWEPDPSVVLTLLRAAREAASNRVIRQMLATFKEMDERDKRAKESGVRSPESGVEKAEVRGQKSEVAEKSGVGSAESGVGEQSGVDMKNWKRMSKEEFAALREKVRQNEEQRRKKEAAQQQEEKDVAMHAPSTNGKLRPAAT